MSRASLALVVPATLAVLGACAPPPMEPRAPTPGVPHFTIETYNVFFRDPGEPSTLAAIGRAGADVVCLEEVNDAWVDPIETRWAETYPHRLYRPDPAGASGYAVLSRFPLLDAGLREAVRHPGWHVFVESPMGTIELLLVHLRPHFKGGPDPVTAYLRVDRDHEREIEVFTGECDPARPTIVLGDFNEEHGTAIAFLEDLGFRDALPLFHPGQATYRHPRSVGGQLDGAIDHVVFSDAFEPLDARVVRAGRSDHFPVVAHLEAAR
jgi:endonuclease/exonuclease/phosphatase (EEP) superfamily protein YafD